MYKSLLFTSILAANAFASTVKLKAPESLTPITNVEVSVTGTANLMPSIGTNKNKFANVTASFSFDYVSCADITFKAELINTEKLMHAQIVETSSVKCSEDSPYDFRRALVRVKGFDNVRNSHELRRPLVIRNPILANTVLKVVH